MNRLKRVSKANWFRVDIVRFLLCCIDEYCGKYSSKWMGNFLNTRISQPNYTPKKAPWTLNGNFTPPSSLHNPHHGAPICILLIRERPKSLQGPPENFSTSCS